MNSAPLSSLFLSSTATGPPLRIGLLLDRRLLDRASASVVRDVLASDFAGIEIVMTAASPTNGAVTDGAAGGARARFRRFRAEGGLAFAAFAVLDQWRAGQDDDPLELDDDPTLLAAIPAMVFAATAPGGAIALSPDQVEQVRNARLDVIVQLGSGQPGGDLLAASRYGVWTLRSGDDRRYRGGPGSYWEVAEGSPVCDIVLVRLGGGRSERRVLDRATVATDAASLARTRRAALYGSTHLVIRNLRLLHERGPAWVETHVTPEPGPPTGGSIDRNPSARDVLSWLVPLTARKVGARIARTARRSDDVLHWRIGIRRGGPALGLDSRPDLTGFRWIESPAGHYYADPFVVERDGRIWLFFEDYSYARGAATIACAEIGEDDALRDVRDVLSSTGHLSYPMIVADGDETLMIPESAAEAVVRIHRAAEFPDRWATAGTLFRGSAVDTSVWQQDGRWWFFTTVHEARGGAGMLLLYHASAVDGEWIPHPLNPISQDARYNRGGGNLFLDEGRLVRPSQDGSRGYGYSITFNEITVLSEDDYAERPGMTITPDREPGLLGMHTYNRAGTVEVMDGKVARSRRSVA